MSGESLWSSLVAVGGILLVSTSVGWALTAPLLPRGFGWSLERFGWSIGFAGLLLAANVCFSLALRQSPGWISFFVLAVGTVAVARRSALPRDDRPVQSRPRPSPAVLLLLALTTAGVLIYVVRSLSEPMWSNDFLAIWGLKGKTIFGDVGIPQRLFRWPEFEFSNPAYPIGLPLVYAGVAFLLGRWEDHAMGLLFPLFQIGTLLVLVGWLRRRGAATTVALGASALVANLGLLYSAWLTGMAEVPASFTFLLLGTAFCDVMDNTDAGGLRRLSLAALLASATKNEGLFLVGTASVIFVLQAVRRRERRLWTAAAAVSIPGLASVFLHRLVLGSHSIRGVDIALLWRPGLVGRLAESLQGEFIELLRPAWPALVALVVLTALARRRGPANQMLLLASASLVTYLLLPALCPLGPVWLIHWTIGRITAALAPLAAAAVGVGWRHSGARAAESIRVGQPLSAR